MRLEIIFLIVLAIGAGPVYGDFRRAKTFEDCHAASCRVNVSDARGSGTFFKELDGFCYILTNYHVVGNCETARLDFWTNGELESATGKVIWKASDATEPWDFAVIRVASAELAPIDPPYIPLMGRNGRPTVESYIISAGAPKGRHIQVWKGKILEYYQDRTAIFKPAPVPGQSGSSIVSIIDGEPWISAILTWLIGAEGSDAAKGGAIPIANLYKATESKKMREASDRAPIPPNATECGDRDGAAPDTRYRADDNNRVPLERSLEEVYPNDTSDQRERVPNACAASADGSRAVAASDQRERVFHACAASADGSGAVAAADGTEPSRDFRTRAPVHEIYKDAALFDETNREWETRLKKRNGIVGRLEDRADEYVDKKGSELLGELSSLWRSLFWTFVFASALGAIIARCVWRFITSLLDVVKGGASTLIKQAAQQIENREGKE